MGMGFDYRLQFCCMNLTDAWFEALEGTYGKHGPWSPCMASYYPFQTLHLKQNVIKMCISLIPNCINIVLVKIFLQWFLDIFNVKMQSENDHKHIKIIYQVKIKDLHLLFVSWFVKLPWYTNFQLWTPNSFCVFKGGTERETNIFLLYQCR